ncbi:MAG: molybdate ABC transporter permease subunit, partial [Bradyrhizobium sp.]
MFEISPTEWTAILLSLRVAVIATLVATPFGIALAWLLARRDFWGKSLLDAAVHLPLVLPPVVTGYLLLLTFGKRGLVGGWLADHLG